VRLAWRIESAATLHGWEGLVGDLPVFVFFGEGFQGPVVGEEGDEPVVGVAGEGGA
jgi:hypothetical protein